MDLDAVADDLYKLTPSEFTPARDSRAADARRAGDREAAAAIKRLRRPTVSAWLANLLAHERADRMNRLLDIGAAMRDAQSRLAGADLRSLSAQRHQVVASLLDEARGLAAEYGQQVGEPAMRELEATLDAALADAHAADALRSGHLSGALQYSGFGSFELTPTAVTTAAAGDVAPVEPPEPTPRPRRPGARKAADRTADGAALEAARRSLDEARASKSAAEREAGASVRRREQARRHRDSRQQEVLQLERRLEDLRAAAQHAEDALVDADRACEEADRRLRQAQTDLAEAVSAVGSLSGKRPGLA